MNKQTITTRRGITVDVFDQGSGHPLLFLHGAGGLLPKDPLLEALSSRFHVYASVWPGFGEQGGEEQLEDMLDFTLHGWDVATALGLERPHLAGHSMGGMIAAEMTALNPAGVDKLVLIDAAGLWLDDQPIPDIFATTPFKMPELLFADPAKGAAMMTGGLDFSNNEALRNFMVGNARRLGMAGKILFPIPNRRLSKRLYRITNPTLLLWGAQDRLIPPAYADAFAKGLECATVVKIEDAGHMLPIEQPGVAAKAIEGFLT